MLNEKAAREGRPFLFSRQQDILTGFFDEGKMSHPATGFYGLKISG
jgi:hypothetical protein